MAAAVLDDIRISHRRPYSGDITQEGNPVTTRLYAVASPTTNQEIISFANAVAYQWGYVDATRAAGGRSAPVPDGWAWAWLEYTRRNASRMAIQDAFSLWVDSATLPGLS
ncbi:hypothetical protein [Actinokineospora sp. NBRC 105648]|uniref:hypothetical protein n=1 Tax=Actinokineospora sp. NBRC 105648 TaxID=3032206 RepID=UPI0024A4A6D9|nr:hypothetical protein [Actinokineospora sp. NBRC 105648]GLZ37870.1 hypothetical protein Acsp05_14940 [Actinokineospora sp. NBRC 105648]